MLSRDKRFWHYLRLLQVNKTRIQKWNERNGGKVRAKKEGRRSGAQIIWSTKLFIKQFQGNTIDSDDKKPVLGKTREKLCEVQPIVFIGISSNYQGRILSKMKIFFQFTELCMQICRKWLIKSHLREKNSVIWISTIVASQ